MENNDSVYIQKKFSGMQVEMLVTPSLREEPAELVIPETDRVEGFVNTIEQYKQQLISSLPLLSFFI